MAGGWIKPEYVEQARQTMDASLWRQEFFGSIESLLGAVYPAFNQQNISNTVDNGGPLLVGCDFNRSPFCGCVLQVQGDVVVVLEEIVLMEADTREFALAVRERYPQRMIHCAPDPQDERVDWLKRRLIDSDTYKNIASEQNKSREGVRLNVQALLNEKRDQLTHLREFLAA